MESVYRDLKTPIINMKIAQEHRSEAEKFINLSYFWFNRTYIEVNKEAFIILEYVNQKINKNAKNDIENQENCINIKFDNNSAFIYQNINNKIPIKDINIKYEFKNLIHTDKFTIDNPNLYEVIAVIEKVNLDNPKDNPISYIQNLIKEN